MQENNRILGLPTINASTSSNQIQNKDLNNKFNASILATNVNNPNQPPPSENKNNLNVSLLATNMNNPNQPPPSENKNNLNVSLLATNMNNTPQPPSSENEQTQSETKALPSENEQTQSETKALPSENQQPQPETKALPSENKKININAQVNNKIKSNIGGNIFNFYKKNIVVYYNFSLIKKLLNKYVSFSDFEEYSYLFMTENEKNNKVKADYKNQIIHYQNELILDTLKTIFNVKQYSDEQYKDKKKSSNEKLSKFNKYMISVMKSGLIQNGL